MKEIKLILFPPTLAAGFISAAAGLALIVTTMIAQRSDLPTDTRTWEPSCSNPSERTHHCLFALAPKDLASFVFPFRVCLVLAFRVRAFAAWLFLNLA